MGAPRIRCEYDALGSIGDTLSQEADTVTAFTKLAAQCAEKLWNNDWEGRGARGFFEVLQAQIFPALERLSSALNGAQQAAANIMLNFSEAEDEAANVFDRTAAPDAPPANLVADTIPAGYFDSRRKPYTTSAPTVVSDHTFRTGKADARRYEVEVNGRKIPVYIPVTQDPSKGHIHTPDQVAKALAAMPEYSLREIKEVNLEPAANPDDDYWKKKYNNPNHYSYMTAGADGIVTIYPTPNAIPQTGLDASMVHETGHIISGREWGGDSQNSAKWQAWRDAIAKDNKSPSGYSKSSPSEDFSEAMVLYYRYKDRTAEQYARKLWPNRFAMIDQILAERAKKVK